jgi:two-component system cell cycle sensor histidine kinase/response regulator CckA
VSQRETAVREELFRVLAERSGNLVSRLDARGMITYVSGSSQRVLGYTPAEMVGMNGFELTHPDDRDVQRAAFLALVARGQDELPPITSRVRRCDGTYAYLETACYITRDATGELAEIYTCARDVTAQTEAKLALEQSEASLRSMLDAMPEAVVVHDHGTIVTVNRAFVDLLGWDSIDDLVGKHALANVHPDDKDIVLTRLDSTVRHRLSPEHRLVRRDGVAIPVEVTGVPCLYEGRVAALAMVHDLRERKRVEAELAAADRMASLGQLSAAVAHEINNPLTYVLGALELLSRDLPRHVHDAGAATALLARVHDALDGLGRVRDVVRDLHALSTTDDGPTGAIDLHRVLDLAAATADHEIGHRAKLERDDGDIALVAGIEGRLIQVFVNLLVNAAQAIPDGDVAGNEIRIVTRMADAAHVTVEILDSGRGLPPGGDERLFEPFYTTKPGAGTGLGLSISRRIVTSFGGTMVAEPRTPRGACFRVTLPVSTAVPERHAVDVDVPPRTDHARVLFADDEPLICKVAAAALAPLEVIAVTSGREAIARLEQGEAFSAIVCDLQMPDLGGIDVHEWIVKFRPELVSRVLFISGGAFTERARAFLAKSQCRLLRKPFELTAIADAVAEIIASSE